MALTKEKLGRKKKIRLPSTLTVPPEQRFRRQTPPPQYTQQEETPGQVRMDDLPEDGGFPAEPAGSSGDDHEQ